MINNILKTQKTITLDHIIYYLNTHAERDRLIQIDKDYEGDRFVELKFTLHGDYVGSTIDKSNCQVLIDRIDSLGKSHQDYFEQLEGIEKYDYRRYSTYSIRLVGDLPIPVWELVLKAIASVDGYPILDDDHYSEQEQEDCWDSWMSSQYHDVIRELEKRNVDVDELEAKAAEDDVYSWLWNIMLDPEKIDSAEGVEIIEVNSQSYYDISDEMLDELATYLDGILVPAEYP